MTDVETGRGEDPGDGTEGDNDRRSIVRIILAELTLVALIFGASQLGTRTNHVFNSPNPTPSRVPFF